MHFLIEARPSGFAPPAEMLANGLRHLQRVVATHSRLRCDEARTIAYAIYLLTREGVVTTNYVLNLRDYLDKNRKDEWQSEMTGVYIAGAMQMLRKDAEAERLIARYRMAEQRRGEWNDFHQPLGSDAQYFAVLAREFPQRLQKISAAELAHITKPISEGNFSTLSAAYAVLALKAYSHAVEAQAPQLTISELDKSKRETRLVSSEKALPADTVLRRRRRRAFSSRRNAGWAGRFLSGRGSWLRSEAT